MPQDNEAKPDDHRFASISSAESPDVIRKNSNSDEKYDSESDRSDLKFYMAPPVIENLDATIKSQNLIFKDIE